VVLIAGGGGLLGRTATHLLSNAGWETRAFAHAELDITNEAEVFRAVDRTGPRLIINCAATADVDRCEREPEWAYAVNETGPRLLARAAAAAGAEIVHVSTDYVFDGSKSDPYTQKDEAHPLSIYGKSKLAGERAVASECDRSYVIRTSWLFGAGGKNFGSRVIEYARNGQHLKGVADQISIPTYASDLAGRIAEIVSRNVYGLYHVTNTGPASWLDFARLALELAGVTMFEIEPVTRAMLNQTAPRPHYSAMRCLLSEELGLAPMRPWREALVDFVRQV
jgi:dTDP-4-dehydrorhamnose reductase